MGLEPIHPKAVDFESTASTNSATSAIVEGQSISEGVNFNPKLYFFSECLLRNKEN